MSDRADFVFIRFGDRAFLGRKGWRNFGVIRGAYTLNTRCRAPWLVLLLRGLNRFLLPLGANRFIRARLLFGLLLFELSFWSRYSLVVD